MTWTAMRVFWACILALAVIAGVTYVSIEISSWLSGPSGAAQEKQLTNDGNNRASSQYQFGQDKSAIETDITSITQAIDNYKADPTAYELSLIEAAASQCTQDVKAYNTLSAGATTGPWRPAEDPESYPTSTCAYVLPAAK